MHRSTQKHVLHAILLVALCSLTSFSFGQRYQEMRQAPEKYTFEEIVTEFDRYFENRDKGKGTGYIQFKRWENNHQNYVDDNGYLINMGEHLWKEHLQYEATRSAKGIAPSIAGEWEDYPIDYFFKGPNGRDVGMGRVNAVAFHPNDPDIIWVGAASGGVWKTTTGGNNWVSLTDGFPVLGISDIVVHPQNPNIIYALTGDGDSKDTQSFGVLKTFDGGDHWFKTAYLNDYLYSSSPHKLIMHPSNPNTLLVVSSKGIFKTTNGGQTWPEVQDGGFTDIEYHPTNPNILYASQAKRLFKSVNGGDTWTPDAPNNSGLPVNPSSSRMEISVSPDEPNSLYLIYSGGTGAGFFTGLYKSTTSGSTFQLQTSTPNLLGGATDGSTEGCNCGYNIAMAVNPNDAAEVFVGAIQDWRSDNNGLTGSWTQVAHSDSPLGQDYHHEDVHDLEFNNGKIYACTDGGIYVSANHGSTWQDLSQTLRITQNYRIGGTEQNPNLIYFGTQDNGANGYAAGNQYINLLPADGIECIVHPVHTDSVYLMGTTGSGFGQLYRSGDQGLNYDNITPGGATTSFVSPFILDPTTPSTLYLGYEDIYKSTNSGNNWTALGATHPDDERYDAIQMSPADNNRLYGAIQRKVFRINATTGNKVDITPPKPYANLNPIWSWIEVDPQNANRLWVTSASAKPSYSVFESVDGGNSWTNISGTLPRVPINCIVRHKNYDDGLFIGTDLGVYYKDDNLDDWIPYMNGLPNVRVRDLEINYASDELRAATYGRGIWRSDLSPNCPFSLVLFDQIESGNHGFEAEETISSTATISGMATGVGYFSGNKILLKPGFTVTAEPLSKFLATPEGCKPSRIITLGVNGKYMGDLEGSLEAEQALAPSIGLRQNDLLVYPNPFWNELTIKYSTGVAAKVKVSVHDLLGREVAVLHSGHATANSSEELHFTAGQLPKGTYLITLEVGGEKLTRKAVKLE